jgi:AcrR family transcriptional regulator
MYDHCMVQASGDRPGPVGRERRTSREAVLAAALRLADAEGASALSMRRVANEVGVPVMTLYGFVRTKQELVQAVSERVFEGLFKSGRSEGTPAQRLLSGARELQAALREHPAVVELVLADAVPSAVFDDVRESFLEIFADAGLSDHQALDALGAFFCIALGFAVAGATREGGDGHADDEVRRLQRLHPTDYPRLTALAPHYPSHLSAESFTGAVEHLIAGFGITDDHITDDQEGHHR